MNAALPASEVLAELVACLARHDRLAIAVSGGVDSMTLAHGAWRFARARPTMYHATGPAVPAAARGRVEAHAARHGWPLVRLDAGELGDARYRANPVDRCYYCKSNLYARIREATPDPIASGTNRDDLDDPLGLSRGRAWRRNPCRGNIDKAIVTRWPQPRPDDPSGCRPSRALRAAWRRGSPSPRKISRSSTPWRAASPPASGAMRCCAAG
jgi:hypothetical protein